MKCDIGMGLFCVHFIISTYAQMFSKNVTSFVTCFLPFDKLCLFSFPFAFDDEKTKLLRVTKTSKGQ